MSNPEFDPLAALWREIEAEVGGSAARIRSLMTLIEARIAAQVEAILSAPRLRGLLASWRGVQQLLAAADDDPLVRVRVMSLSRRELDADLGGDGSGAFEDGTVFARVYDDAIATTGGEPFGVLVADYGFANTPADLAALSALAAIGAVACAPVVAEAAPGLLGLAAWREVGHGRDAVRAVAGSPHFAKWRALRDDPDTRFLCLALPRVSAGPVAGAADSGPLWMNAAYAAAARLVGAFARDGWWADLSLPDGGAIADDLAAAGAGTGPAELALPPETALELESLGLLALSTPRPRQPPALGVRTVHRPRQYDRPDATAAAQVGARLPCVLGMARFAHVVMVMGREAPGTMGRAAAATRLAAWIAAYVGPEQPLHSARIEIRDPPPGDAGAPLAVLWLRPRLHDDLATELRSIVRVPWVARGR